MNIHLLELRTRVIKSFFFVVTIFVLLFIIRNKLYEIIALPLQSILPKGHSLVATDITTTFIIPTKLSLILAVYISIPFVFYQAWKFIVPGLYKNEKQAITPMLILSTSLFYTGNIFSFCIICPLALSFFTNCAPQDVLIMADIKEYLNFIITISIATGIAFQIPLITKLTISSGICNKQSLQQKRPFVIVGSFILGMLLTPPDVISQILLAIPIWGLFELGLILSASKK